MNFPKLTKNIFLFLLVAGGCFLIQDAHSANDDARTSAGVLDEKVRTEAKEKILKPRPIAPVKIEEKKVKETKAKDAPFFVSKFILEGDPVLDPEDYRKIFKEFENKEVSFEQMNAIVSALEQALRSQGYLAVVILPPQKTRDNEVRLKIVVSRMGELSVLHNRYFSSRLIESYWDIEPGALMRYDELRQSALALNDNHDRLVNVVLKAGEKPGTSDVLLNVQDRFPVHAGYSLDNQGVKASGKTRHGFTLRHNNLAGFDDVFLAGTALGRDFRAAYLFYTLPITDFGTKLIASYSHAAVRPSKELAVHDIDGRSYTYGAALLQNLMRTEHSYASVQLGYDYKQKDTDTAGAVSAWDREHVFSLRGDFQTRDRGGVWALGQGMSFGTPCHDKNKSLASGEADVTFFKYMYSVTRTQALLCNTRLVWDVQGQYSQNRLLPQEEMFLGGAKSVRGYPESDFGADSAIQSRLDYLIPVFVFPQSWNMPGDREALRDKSDLICFFDCAYGKNNDPTSWENHSQSLVGIGTGFQFAFRDNMYTRFEWGMPLGHEPLSEGGNSQFHFIFRVDY